MKVWLPCDMEVWLPTIDPGCCDMMVWLPTLDPDCCDMKVWLPTLDPGCSDMVWLPTLDPVCCDMEVWLPTLDPDHWMWHGYMATHPRSRSQWHEGVQWHGGVATYPRSRSQWHGGVGPRVQVRVRCFGRSGHLRVVCVQCQELPIVEVAVVVGWGQVPHLLELQIQRK